MAQWGKSEALFEKVAEVFLLSGQFKASLSNPAVRPTWKSLKDRFKKLVADRRAENYSNRLASGISEVHGERETLLDEIIQQIDDKKEAEMT